MENTRERTEPITPVVCRLDRAFWEDDLKVPWRRAKETIIPALVAAGIGRRIGRYLYARRDSVLAFMAGELDESSRLRRSGGRR